MNGLTLIKKVQLFAPENQGLQDVLIAGEKIVAIQPEIKIESNFPILEIEGRGKFLVPGFVDNHVHILGGGGEGGFKTRTPEIMLGDIVEAGVTTLVGCLGTDGTTRHLSSLVAKARGLQEEGVTCYAYTGSYEIPVKTLTGSVRDDLILIETFIGVGEIALSDHRASNPSFQELARLAADAHVGGMLAGKKGTIVIHMGDARERFSLIEEVVNKTPYSITQFLPTHINRSPELLQAAFSYLKKGGNVDLTTSVPAHLPDGSDATAADALAWLLEMGAPIEQISMSSDAQGSLPEFDKNGNFIGLGVGKIQSLYLEFKKAIQKNNIPLEIALLPVTKNPARFLGLEGKGQIKVGNSADLLILDQDLNLQFVMAKGQILMQHGEKLVKGTFEK